MLSRVLILVLSDRTVLLGASGGGLLLGRRINHRFGELVPQLGSLPRNHRFILFLPHCYFFIYFLCVFCLASISRLFGFHFASIWLLFGFYLYSICILISFSSNSFHPYLIVMMRITMIPSPQTLFPMHGCQYAVSCADPCFIR